MVPIGIPLEGRVQDRVQSEPAGITLGKLTSRLEVEYRAPCTNDRAGRNRATLNNILSINENWSD